MKKIAGLILMSIIMWFFSISTTFACSCMQPWTATQRLESSDLVFQGTVTQIVDTTIIDDFIGSIPNNNISFDVKGYWKWDLNGNTIKTSNSSASCWYNFQEDKEYIVYASYNESTNTYSTSLCSGNTLVENSQNDKKELWEFQNDIPEDAIDNIIPESSEKNNFVFIALAIILILGMIFTGLKKAQQKK